MLKWLKRVAASILLFVTFCAICLGFLALIVWMWRFFIRWAMQ